MEDSMYGYGHKSRDMKTYLNSKLWIIVGQDGKRRFTDKTFLTRSTAEAFADKFKGIYDFQEVSYQDLLE